MWKIFKLFLFLVFFTAFLTLSKNEANAVPACGVFEYDYTVINYSCNPLRADPCVRDTDRSRGECNWSARSAGNEWKCGGCRRRNEKCTWDFNYATQQKYCTITWDTKITGSEPTCDGISETRFSCSGNPPPDECDANSDCSNSNTCINPGADNSTCEARYSCNSNTGNCGKVVGGSSANLNTCNNNCDADECDNNGDCGNGEVCVNPNQNNSTCVACSWGGWSNTSCGSGSCTSTQMRQTRNGTPAACGTQSQCVNDAYTQNNWQNGTCGGGSCLNSQMSQTRNSQYSCLTNFRCEADAAGNWTNGACGGASGNVDCISTQRLQTRTVTNGCQYGTAQCVPDSACVPPTYSISGRVYVDNNNDLGYDAGEAYQGGARVERGTGNNPPFDTTDANGNYSFAGLSAGNYIIHLDVPSGHTLPQAAQTNDVTVSVGPNQTLNFRLRPAAAPVTPTPTPPPTYTVNVSFFHDNISNGSNNNTYQAGEPCYVGGAGVGTWSMRPTGTAHTGATNYTYTSSQYNPNDCLMTITTTDLNHTVRALRGSIPYTLEGYSYRDATTNGGFVVVGAPATGIVERALSGSTIRFALSSLVIPTDTPTPTPPPPPPTATPTPPPSSYSIQGRIFLDTNPSNRLRDAGELDYSTNTGISISPSAGASINVTSGLYNITGLSAGTYTVTYAKDPGYSVTVPTSVGTPNFPGATVGTSCSAPASSPEASCSTGNIINLNFGLNDAAPFIQSIGGGIWLDDGIDNQIPDDSQINNACYSTLPVRKDATILNAPGGFPGVVVSEGDNDHGQGVASSTEWEVEAEPFKPAVPGTIRTAYNYVLSNVRQQGITPTVLCAGNANCNLPNNLVSGIYIINGNTTITGNLNVPANRRIVILVNGNLILSGNINVPAGSYLLFSAGGGPTKGNITVAPTVGDVQATSTTPHLEGVFSADRNFIIAGGGSCGTERRLNMEGSIVANAALSGGSFQNLRNTCDNQCPVFTILQRLDFLINMPNILKAPSYIYREIAP